MSSKHSSISLQDLFWQPISSNLIQGKFVKFTKFSLKNLASIGVGKFIIDMEVPSKTLNSTGDPSVFLNSLYLSAKSLLCLSLMAVGNPSRPSLLRTPKVNKQKSVNKNNKKLANKTKNYLPWVRNPLITVGALRSITTQFPGFDVSVTSEFPHQPKSEFKRIRSLG